jgi:hypothetical protein
MQVCNPLSTKQTSHQPSYISSSYKNIPPITVTLTIVNLSKKNNKTNVTLILIQASPFTILNIYYYNGSDRLNEVTLGFKFRKVIEIKVLMISF